MFAIQTSTLVPIRSVIWMMLFTCTLFLYVLRTNMSLILIDMVDDRDFDGTEPVPECKLSSNVSENNHTTTLAGRQTSDDHLDQGANKYQWDSKLQGLILGAYFWGFVISNIPGAAVAERFGPRKAVTVSFSLSALLTLLGPLCAKAHPFVLIGTRFLIGILGGIVYPAIHCLISHWAPPSEKGKFISSTLGGSLGTVITWPLLGNVIERAGWEWAFYISGLLVLVWTVGWMMVVYDTPKEHPWICDSERDHIVSTLSGTVTTTKRSPPYKSILTSVPAWALCVAQFGNLWGLFFLMTAGPKFMSSVLGFDLGHTGFLAAIPYLARMLAGFVFGILGDCIVKKELMSKTTVRKTFTFMSHMVPGILLISQTFVGCQADWVIVLLTLSLASNGASTITNLSNAQDLAPNFAGSLYGIANCIGSTTGFISPMVVGYLTADHNGMAEWHTIFYIGASVYIGCGLFFAAFSSAEVQSWNYCDKPDTPTQKPDTFDNLAFENDSERPV